MMMFRSQAQMM